MRDLSQATDSETPAFVGAAESTRVLETLVSNLPGMVYRCRNDLAWTMELVSEGCAALTGHPASALLHNSRVCYADLIHPHDRDLVWREVQAALVEKRAFQVSYRIITATGVEKWVWEQGRGVFDAAGELLALEGFITDISDRRRAEDRLRERELLLGTIFEASSNALLLTDPHGIITLANAAARRLFAMDGQLGSASLADVVRQGPPALREPILHRRDGLVGDAEGETYHLSHETVRLEQVEHTLLVAKEMTQVLRHQEVATWKKVIRVFNHELGNSLAPITSLSQSARTIAARLDGGEKLDAVLATIGERAAHLSTFLRAYAEVARLPNPQRQQACWEKLLEHAVAAAGFQPTVLEPPPKTGGYFDPAQLQQVLINLFKNAREAGSATHDIAVRFHKGERNTRIDVLDRGTGIPPRALSQVLLPFYTTKPTGSGLGLALCREILEAHDGGIEVANRPDGGAVITCIVGHFIAANPVVGHPQVAT